MSELPLNFQHAIEITKNIDCQYVWIDSLCIVQHNKDEWDLACDTMGYIYGNAYVVIAATFAPKWRWWLLYEQATENYVFRRS